jgi:hypothetical protein
LERRWNNTLSSVSLIAFKNKDRQDDDILIVLTEYRAYCDIMEGYIFKITVAEEKKEELKTRLNKLSAVNICYDNLLGTIKKKEGA